jgi:hypothetical protein
MHFKRDVHASILNLRELALFLIIADLTTSTEGVFQSNEAHPQPNQKSYSCFISCRERLRAMALSTIGGIVLFFAVLALFNFAAASNTFVRVCVPACPV